MRFVRPAVLVPILAAWLAAPAVAAADFRLSAGVDGSMLLAEYARETTVWEADPGMSANVLVGVGLPTRHVTIIPEASFGWAKFADPYGRDTLRVLAGLRVALPGEWEPSLFVHAGYGRSEGIDSDAVLQRSGLALDGGLALATHLDAHWALGAQLAYNGLLAETGSGTDLTHWLSLGLRVDTRW